MFAVFLPILFGLAWIIFETRYDALIYIAAGFLFLAILVPNVLLPLNRLWMKFAFFLGGFMNTVILGFFFFLILTPVGLLMRLVGRDPLSMRSAKLGESYLTPVNRHSDSENYSDLF